MHVGLGVVGDVVVDDVGDARHVQPARGNVGGDDDVERAALELFDHALAQLLGHVAVEGRDRIAARLELFGELDGGGLGAHEDDRGVEVLLDLEDARQRVELVHDARLHVALADRRHRGGRRLDLHLLRLAQVTVRHAPDRVRHGGGEERGLTLGGCVLQDPLDVVDEAHAQHLVGLVQHQRGEAGELQALALDVVHDAARRAHHHMRTSAQLAQLHHHALPAIHRQHVEAGQVLGVALEGLRDLDRELARGGQHQHLRIAHAEVEAVQQRQRERGGLAGAGLRFAEEVGAGQQHRDAGGLDRGRGFVANLLEGLEELGAERELREGFSLGGHARGTTGRAGTPARAQQRDKPRCYRIASRGARPRWRRRSSPLIAPIRGVTLKS